MDTKSIKNEEIVIVKSEEIIIEELQNEEIHNEEIQNEETDNESKNINKKKKSKPQKCGQCEGCTRQNCGLCIACLDKPRFGGPGLKKRACKFRVCIQNKRQTESDTPKSCCKFCDKKFKTSAALVRHVGISHFNEIR